MLMKGWQCDVGHHVSCADADAAAEVSVVSAVPRVRL
jgi:hypothetical protein